MTDGDREELPAGEAFEILGNELRLSILRVLYDETHAGGPAFGTVSFSELQTAVGEEDSGRFSYHLNRLQDHFVEKRDGEYAIRSSGIAVVRAIRSGTVTSKVAFGPEPVDVACYRCGSDDVTVSYDEVFVTRCHDCAGCWRGHRFPRGTLTALTFRPSGLANRDPENALESVHARFRNHAVLMAHGVCPNCGAETGSELRICDEHEESRDELCGACETGYPHQLEFRCVNCERGRVTIPAYGRMDHPAVARAVDAHDAAKPNWTAWTRLYDMETEVREDDDGVEIAYFPEDARAVAVDDDLTVRVL